MIAGLHVLFADCALHKLLLKASAAELTMSLVSCSVHSFESV